MTDLSRIAPNGDEKTPRHTQYSRRATTTRTKTKYRGTKARNQWRNHRR